MIAELAAANAAYDVIKQTIANGQEIYQAAEAMAQYFGLKNEIQQKAHEHGYKSDLEAFMAAEQLKAQEEELKQMELDDPPKPGVTSFKVLCYVPNMIDYFRYILVLRGLYFAFK